LAERRAWVAAFDYEHPKASWDIRKFAWQPEMSTGAGRPSPRCVRPPRIGATGAGRHRLGHVMKGAFELLTLAQRVERWATERT
jgi:hypothetical protein